MFDSRVQELSKAFYDTLLRPILGLCGCQGVPEQALLHEGVQVSPSPESVWAFAMTSNGLSEYATQLRTKTTLSEMALIRRLGGARPSSILGALQLNNALDRQHKNMPRRKTARLVISYAPSCPHRFAQNRGMWRAKHASTTTSSQTWQLTFASSSRTMSSFLDREPERGHDAISPDEAPCSWPRSI